MRQGRDQLTVSRLWRAVDGGNNGGDKSNAMIYAMRKRYTRTGQRLGKGKRHQIGKAGCGPSRVISSRPSTGLLQAWRRRLCSSEDAASSAPLINYDHTPPERRPPGCKVDGQPQMVGRMQKKGDARSKLSRWKEREVEVKGRFWGRLEGLRVGGGRRQPPYF